MAKFKPKEIYLAGGCFWGLQKYLKAIPGVLSTEVGYANGKTKNPTYEEVCYQNTGHAETVRVVYHPVHINLSTLLKLFIDAIDPTSVNRQGNDVGTQYRSGIYYLYAGDLPIIEKVLKQVQSKLDKPLAIEVKPLENFYPAEEYHQNYLDKNPEAYCHICPNKIEKVKDALMDPVKS